MLTKAIPVFMLLAATSALGADPFLGSWKVSVRSLLEAAPALPMNLTADYKLGANGDLLVTMTAFLNNQTVHTEIVKNYGECDGSEQQAHISSTTGKFLARNSSVSIADAFDCMQ